MVNLWIWFSKFGTLRCSLAEGFFFDSLFPCWENEEKELRESLGTSFKWCLLHGPFFVRLVRLKLRILYKKGFIFHFRLFPVFYTNWTSKKKMLFICLAWSYFFLTSCSLFFSTGSSRSYFPGLSRGSSFLITNLLKFWLHTKVICATFSFVIVSWCVLCDQFLNFIAEIFLLACIRTRMLFHGHRAVQRCFILGW